ncbi:MAG: hypothetical protein ACRDQZ_13760 [Mycobacteriales bacterium]
MGRRLITAQKREARAAEYRRLAREASAVAATSPLDHVREKHALAAQRWRDLAVLDERTTPVPWVRPPEPPQRRAAGIPAD